MIKVVVHFESEEEKEIAVSVLNHIKMETAFCIGMTDGDGFKTLQDHDLFVEVLHDQTDPFSWN